MDVEGERHRVIVFIVTRCFHELKACFKDLLVAWSDPHRRQQSIVGLLHLTGFDVGVYSGEFRTWVLGARRKSFEDFIQPS